MCWKVEENLMKVSRLERDARWRLVDKLRLIRQSLSSALILLEQFDVSQMLSVTTFLLSLDSQVTLLTILCN